ncbi:MAG: DNA-3-methyladenine glycosylase family protein [Oscillospiraceae bacterium]
MSRFFVYGEKEMDYLSARDKKLGAVISRLGFIERGVIPDLFEALVNSIAGQQISSKALETVWGRITERLSPITPEHFCELSDEDIRACGLSARKTGYIKAAAQRFAEGSLNAEALKSLPDDELIKQLTELNGIGKWSAEMLMLFSLERQDVLSYGDFGIMRGLRMLYRHREITPELFERYRKRYSPYGSVASIYLWAISAGAVEGLHDPAQK